MYSLYIDTHSFYVTIVLFKNGIILAKKEIESLKSHSIHTMPAIENILKENNIKINDITEIIVVNGPGSFTGVRIGVTIAKTLAYTLNVPIKVISSLLVKIISSGADLAIVSDRNGKFIGSKDISEYKYLRVNEYEEYIKDKKIEIVDEVEIDYEKVYEYLKNIDAITPHKVNPIYIKNIEV